MTKHIVLGGLIGAVLAAALGLFVVKPSFSAPMFERTKWVSDYFSVGTSEQFHVDQDGDLTTSGSVTVGSNGTALGGIVSGSCTIWAGATTITASSSVTVECQSATNGGLSASLSGVTSDSVCSLLTASSTSATFGSIAVVGVSPTTTGGSLVARILNNTGTTFTWNATASSTPKWKYSCVDPA